LNQTPLETEKQYAPTDINFVLTASLEFKVFGCTAHNTQHALYAEHLYLTYQTLPYQPTSDRKHEHHEFAQSETQQTDAEETQSEPSEL